MPEWRGGSECRKYPQALGARLDQSRLLNLVFDGLGLFKATGLTDRIGDVFISLSTPSTFPAVVSLYSGVVIYLPLVTLAFFLWG